MSGTLQLVITIVLVAAAVLYLVAQGVRFVTRLRSRGADGACGGCGCRHATERARPHSREVSR